MAEQGTIDERDVDDSAAPIDGRVARRQRNVDAVLDVVLELFGEELMFPTIEQAATRSGLSLRSLYRYFADPGELLEATIRRSRERGFEAAQLHAIGDGPLAHRIDEFVAMRLRLYDEIGLLYRATVVNAAQLPRIREELAQTRRDFSTQFSAQFAPELRAVVGDAQDPMMSAGDVLTQLDSIDFLRRHQELSAAKTEAILVSGLTALFA